MLEMAAAVVLLAALVMYACFAGADFGGGIWTALASGPRVHEQRESLFKAIGPVWETNHIWLVFVVVALFTLFPSGFAALFTALPVPLVAALVGINLRGAAFAFRHYGRETSREVPPLAKTFEISSVLTPFALGSAVTATALGKVGPDGAGEPLFWLTPFTLTGGLIGMGICAYLAPIYMTVRTTDGLREDFRLRGMLAGFALALLTSVEIPLALVEAPVFSSRLLGGWGRYFVLAAVVAGSLTEVLLWRRTFTAARISAAATVSLTIAGFGAALYPDLLVGQLSLHQAAAPHATLAAFFGVLPFGALVLVPSLVLLYRLFGRVH